MERNDIERSTVVGLRIASWLIAFLPSGAGKGSVAQAVYRRRLEGRRGPRVRVRLKGGARVDLDLSDRSQAETFLTREYEPALQRFILRRLRPGSHFIDIGAHIGLIAIAVAARARSLGVTVHAFEPDPVNAAALRHNLSLNPGLRVRVIEQAISSGEGVANFERDRSDSQLGMIRPDEQPSGDGLTVRTTTIDQFTDETALRAVAVVKIDAEGHEAEILAGGSESLSRKSIECLICELNPRTLSMQGSTPEEIVSILGERGYRPQRIPGVGLRRWLRRHGDEFEDVAFFPAGSPREAYVAPDAAAE